MKNSLEINENTVILTGITVGEQMRRAREILIKQVIPQEKEFQRRKKNGTLSPRLLRALKKNA